jgi:hypothetical protein
MGTNSTDEAIRAIAAQRHLPESHLARWLAMDADSRRAMLEDAQALRLHTGQIVAALDLLDEIGVRERAAASAILARKEVRGAIAHKGSGPARAAAFLDALRAIRFPRLKQTRERISARIAELGLPRGVAVVLPRELGSDELVVRLSARTADEMARLIRALAAREQELARIAAMLGGDDEV